MVPGIGFVEGKVQLVHCCRILLIACEVVQPFYLFLHKPLTLFVETSLVPWSQMKPLDCQDRHSLRLEVQDALPSVEIGSDQGYLDGHKDWEVAMVELVALLALDRPVE